jgi:hypothetical protein
MQVFDASSVIYAWDNYPISQFPGLWEWLAEQIKKNKLVMPRVAFDEVENKTPECGAWLKDNSIGLIDINNVILQEAVRIKKLLGITGDSYHVKGVGENDIFIIATASVHNSELVSNEGRQKLPDILAKSKIPVVCAMQGVAVPCVNFIEFIKESGAVFR